jgi:hypothetical protein
LNISQDDDGAEVGGEGVEAVLDGMFEFVGFGDLLGGHGCVGQPAWGFDFFLVIVGRFEWDGGTALFAAQFVVAGVGDGAQQPGFERSAAKAVDVPKAEMKASWVASAAWSSSPRMRRAVL